MDVISSMLTNKGVEILEYINIENYSIRHYMEGKLHRLNGPAAIILTGQYSWTKKGIRLRPSNTFLKLSFEEWYLNGEYNPRGGHRIFPYNEGLGSAPNVELTEDNTVLVRWYLYGNHVPITWLEENIANIRNITKEEKILMKLRWA